MITVSLLPYVSKYIHYAVFGRDCICNTLLSHTLYFSVVTGKNTKNRLSEICDTE